MSEGNKSVHTFLRSIIPKVNVIAEFELAYFAVIYHHFSDYAIGTLSLQFKSVVVTLASFELIINQLHSFIFNASYEDG